MKKKALLLTVILLLCTLVGCTDDDYYYRGEQLLKVGTGTHYYESRSTTSNVYIRVIPTPYVDAAVTTPMTSVIDGYTFHVFDHPADQLRLKNTTKQEVEVVIQYKYSDCENPMKPVGEKDTASQNTVKN